MAEYVRPLEERIIEGNMKYVELAATSGATLPTENIVTGSLAFIVGGYVQMFDEKSGEWTDFADFGAGSEQADLGKGVKTVEPEEKVEAGDER